MESINGQMEKNIMDFGLMVSKKDMEFFIRLMAQRNMEFGQMVEKISGILKKKQKICKRNGNSSISQGK